MTQAHLERVTGYVNAGVKEGATLVLDGLGQRPVGHEKGFFIGPSLFDHVNPSMSIYQDEIFGPVLSVVRLPYF